MIRPVKLLGRVDHLLGIGQFGGRTIEHHRFGPDAGPRAELAEGEVADCDSDQIGCHRVRHAKAEALHVRRRRGRIGLVPLGRAHHGGQFRRNRDMGRPGLADSRRILGRNPGSILDRLALAEQIGVLLARGLLRRQPLERTGIGSRLVGDDDLALVAHLNGQGRAQILVLGADLEGQGNSGIVGNRLDLKPLVVEHDFPNTGLGLDVERRRAADALGREIHGKVQVQVRDPRLQRLGIAVNVDRVGRVEDRRHLGLDGGGRPVALAGHEEQGRGGGQETHRQSISPDKWLRRFRQRPCKRC